MHRRNTKPVYRIGIWLAALMLMVGVASACSDTDDGSTGTTTDTGRGTTGDTGRPGTDTGRPGTDTGAPVLDTGTVLQYTMQGKAACAEPLAETQYFFCFSKCYRQDAQFGALRFGSPRRAVRLSAPLQAAQPRLKCDEFHKNPSR